MVRTEDDNTCRSIAALFVLGATELNHVLRSRVGNVDFAQDGIAVVGQSRMYASRLGQDGGKTTCNMPPMGSRIILSMALGPKHVRITSATV